ncbi:gamma carbonic anhydrase family protein [Paenibacillus senegalensis]|uniref:gamma carbonic anhydrase family protein n=1 Tax=Paenibacillus senegalensis TaxID=1465766 RepID=UPI00028953A3|nr:gamma carbonic anhydrase family protein [Paenibacillus senegalensis]
MVIGYKGKLPKLHPSVFLADGVKLIGEVNVREESSLWYNAVLRADLSPIEIGARCNIQDGCIGHVNANQPLWLEDEVSVGHGAIIHGCKIGKGSLIGMGAIVLNGAVLGEYSLIGAGSVVTENKVVPPYTLSLGTPARVVRELTEADLERMKQTAASYVIKGREYRGEERL